MPFTLQFRLAPPSPKKIADMISAGITFAATPVQNAPSFEFVLDTDDPNELEQLLLGFRDAGWEEVPP